MIKVAFTSGGGNNAFLDDFNLDVTLNQKDLSAAQINIYPNPSNGRFNVEGLPAGTPYTIYSTDGQAIQRGLLDLDAALELAAPAGYYLFQAASIRKALIIQ